MNFITWLPILISLIAIAISIWAGYNTQQSRKAAQVSADAAQRTVEERHFRWSVEHVDDCTYIIRNEGTITALDVSIHTGAIREKVLRDETPLNLGPGEAVNFVAFLGFQHDCTDFTITWTPNLPGADRRSWIEPWPIRRKD